MDGRTRHDEANSRFSQFCGRAKKGNTRTLKRAGTKSVNEEKLGGVVEN
jgi:hypothetical protein